MSGRSWKGVDSSIADEIKSYLMSNGGEEQEAKGAYESWRVKFSDSTFTYYSTGTLYSTPSKADDPSVMRAWKTIDSLVGSAYELPSKEFLIGLDETGKGEVIGHTVLTGVIFPKEIFQDLDLILGPADTKKRHEFEYWDDIFKKLDRYRPYGLNFIIEKIPPWVVDRYNLNKIMDITYQRILNVFFRKADIEKCRIVLDDYGIGDTLRRFLNFLELHGAEVIVVSGSEERYLEAKAASLLSKRTREGVMKAINNNPEFKIDDLSVGSGNAGNPQTRQWLERWYATHRSWPWFVKRSFRNIRELEGKTGKVTKAIPPIKENLLADEFIEEFNKGNLSIQALSLVCPHCGAILKTARFGSYRRNGRNISGLKCFNSECGEFIADAGMTLRYYCGYVVPDSNAIQRRLLSNDLSASRFFEDFTVLLVPVVRKETDGTPRGREEFERLKQFSAKGRIKLETVGSVDDVSDGLSGTVRDEKIIEECVKHNAILLTADKSMATFAEGKEVFTIYA